MSETKDRFQAYIAQFPPKPGAALARKLAYKKKLEEDRSFKIPTRIWLAFLTPPSADLWRKPLSIHSDVAQLKKAMLETFQNPKQFLEMRNPLHKVSECITLAVLETLYDLEESKILLTREQYEEWIEIAEHFGLWKLRYALEDMIFKTFDADAFAAFESVIEKQIRMDHEKVSSIRAIVKDALKRAGITEFSLLNRRKNVYGVYQKISVKGISVNEIFDIHGFRILTPTQRECYAATEILHRLWRQYPDRYKDYIEKPKENGYQSIHTVLLCLGGQPIEFQVRTYDMDLMAESGPANHPTYKKNLRVTTTPAPAHS